MALYEIPSGWDATDTVQTEVTRAAIPFVVEALEFLTDRPDLWKTQADFLTMRQEAYRIIAGLMDD